MGDKSPCYLLQDHKRCLWNPFSVSALKDAGCPVISDFPKTSPYLNAIENAWKLVRKRFQETEPVEIESRAIFVARLRLSVTWINDPKSDKLLHLCTNHKERARDVLNANPHGGKTKSVTLWNQSSWEKNRSRTRTWCNRLLHSWWRGPNYNIDRKYADPIWGRRWWVGWMQHQRYLKPQRLLHSTLAWTFTTLPSTRRYPYPPPYYGEMWRQPHGWLRLTVNTQSTHSQHHSQHTVNTTVNTALSFVFYEESYTRCCCWILLNKNQFLDAQMHISLFFFMKRSMLTVCWLCVDCCVDCVLTVGWL